MWRKRFFGALRIALSTTGNSIHTDQVFEITPENRILFHPLADDQNAQVYFSPRLALQLGLENGGPFNANQTLYGVKP